MSEQSRIPAELQSPKIIIEEQMDKVVTKIDPYLNMKNTVYPMDDGSSILERESPEAITTTTIAKERFIVRPLDGNIHSEWMDVTHTLIEDHESEPSQDNTNNNKPPETLHGPGENESIYLDISGYKTSKEDESHDNSSNLPTSHSRMATPDISAGEITDPESWGWKKTAETTEKVKSTTATEENDTVQLKSGHVYRIEMSLCGFSAFGYDEDENNLLFKDKQVTYDDFVHNPSILNDPRLVFRYNNHFYAAVRTSPLFTSLLIFKRPLEDKETPKTLSESRDTYSYGRGWRQWLSRSSTAEAVPLVGDENSELQPPSEAPLATEQGQQQPPAEGERTTFTTTTKTTSVGWSPDHNHNDDIFTRRKMYAKTLRLTSDQLKNLNLKKGVNTVSFSVKSAYQGTATCAAKLFFWDHDIQVVISDIDGTITKSDAMGHLMTMIGKDWTHEGVAQLYTDIANNGYHFMYLTSRAIGQADYTRDYLKKVQQGNYQLPDGPVIMSPDRLFTSFHREVIIRKPEMFKMACLKDIQRLFGGRDPFYAGFGNRITDAISYRSVNVPSSRIFTIDPYGDLKLELLTGFKSSYIHLNDLVDQMFPPIDKTIHEEFNDFNYWKSPMLEFDIPELEEEGPIPTSPKPKPIKPDPNALPKESVVAAEPKRGLLGSFTRSSRSTSTSLRSSPSRSPSISSITSNKSNSSAPPPVKPNASSSSAPSIITTSDMDKMNISSPPTSPLALPTSYSPELEPVSPRTGLISKVMGGVFSRKAPAAVEKTAVAVDNEKVLVETTATEENGEDDEFNDEIDDLDLDDIPFI